MCLYCCCLLSSCSLYQNLSSDLGNLFLPHWGMFYSVCVISWTGFNFYFLNSEDLLLNSLCMFQKHSVFSVNHSSFFGVSLGVIILAYVSYLMFLHIVIFNLFFQQVLMSLPGCVVTAVLVSGSVCGEHDEVLKAKLLATTIFLSGITTFLQVTFGVRYCKINF